VCGIFGAVDLCNGVPFEQKSSEIQQTFSQLKNRGPDNSGYWADEQCFLGHTRLSIVDTSSAGRQPMLSSCGRYAGVFNGEIYNFSEVRDNIDSKVQWRSSSDTEVLLESWRLFGEDCLDHLDGMFAFAIWDRKKQKLTLARDRFGEKPLYYLIQNASIHFCSRPSPIFTLQKQILPKLNKNSVGIFLQTGYFPSDRTVYDNVKKLNAGSVLEFFVGGVKHRKYWDFASIETNENLNSVKETELVDNLDTMLQRSVKRCLTGDVPIGSFLSSGIDSGLITAIAAKHYCNSLQTYTIGFNEHQYDESAAARRVAKHIGVSNNTQKLNVNDLLSFIPTFQNNFDEPFFDSSAFPTMAVSKLAAGNVKVALTGDGGDELFGGYHYYMIMGKISPIFSLPKLVRLGLANAFSIFPGHKTALFASLLRMPDVGSAFGFMRSIAKDYELACFHDLDLNIHELFSQRQADFPRGISVKEVAMRLDASFTLIDDYLQKTDLSSMSYSLECRAPMLSREIVEWSMSLPDKWKVRGNANKYLLRQVAYRYIPAKIIDRPKQGFGVPINEWLRGPLCAWAEERLFDRSSYDGLPISRDESLELYSVHKSGKRNFHSLLWALLMLIDFKSRVCI
jgi:asparagine synthase (glutamine-hydrolysing)